MKKSSTNNGQELKRLTEKFSLELELRYREVRNGDDYYRTPKIVIGIYDSWDEAEKVGNEVISNCLANHFTIRDKFVKNYVYGMPNDLICNHGSDGKPSVFFAIRKLKMTTDVETFVTDAIAKYEEYKKWERNQGED